MAHNERNHKKKKLPISPTTVSAVVFFILIIVLPLILLLSKKQTVSELENRTLTTFPKASLTGIFDRSYMNGFERYFSDHFPGRVKWIEAKTRVELAIGKDQINGVYVTPERLIQQIDRKEKSITDRSVEAMLAFSRKYPETEPYLMLVPTAEQIYRDQISLNVPVFDQKLYIEDVYKSLHGNTTAGSSQNSVDKRIENPSGAVSGIDVYTPLNAAKSDYIYYKTDHHWTSAGAYAAYSAAGRRLGFQPVLKDKFNIDHAAHNFLGTLFSKTLYTRSDEDIIDLYTYPSGPQVTSVTLRDGNKVQEADSIFFREWLRKKDKYSVFLDTNHAVVDIKTDAKPEKRLLVFKDSYANSMMQFLSLHYSRITMVDLRYLNEPYTKYVKPEEYDQTLFLYNVDSMLNDDSIQKVAQEDE